MVSMYGVQHLEYCFWKEFFLLPEAVSIYILQHSEFALGKKKYLTWNSFYVLCMTFHVLLPERKKSSFFFPMQYYVEIVDFFGTPEYPISVNPPPPFIDEGF